MAFTRLSNRVKMVDGGRFLYLKLWPKLTTTFKNADFQSIFARSVSAVTPGIPLWAF